MESVSSKSSVRVFFERDGAMVEVFDLEVEGTGLAACETVFAILNSYPEEMFCDRKYLALVEAFRGCRNRSMSVGDVLDVDGVRYECADFGFKTTAVAR